MDAIAQVSTVNYGFPKVVGPVSLDSFKNKLISLQWSLGTRGTEQSSQQRCFFNQLELLAIVQDSTQSSPHCWATTLTSQWEILFEQGLHDLTQLKSFFFLHMVSSADWFKYISHFVFGLWRCSAFGHPNILAHCLLWAFLPFLSGCSWSVQHLWGVLSAPCDQDADMSTTARLSFLFAALAQQYPLWETLQPPGC